MGDLHVVTASSAEQSVAALPLDEDEWVDEDSGNLTTEDPSTEPRIFRNKRPREPDAFETYIRDSERNRKAKLRDQVVKACSKGSEEGSIKMECLYGSIEVPRSLLLHSPIWKDALEISELGLYNSLPVAGSTSTSTAADAKKRKLNDKAPMKLSDNIDGLRIVFGILSGDPQGINQQVRYSRNVTGDPYYAASNVIRIADKYELPGVHKQFMDQLWALAANSKEEAIVVYAIAFDQLNAPLARHAMRHFEDTCHPIRVESRNVLEPRLRVWKFLVRALWDHREDPLGWVKVADEISYPSDWKQDNEIAQDLDLFCGRDRVNSRQGERVRLRSEDV